MSSGRRRRHRGNEKTITQPHEIRQDSDRHGLDSGEYYLERGLIEARSRSRIAVAAVVYTSLTLLMVFGWLLYELFLGAPIRDRLGLFMLGGYIPFATFGMLYTLSLNTLEVHFRFPIERAYFIAKLLFLPLNALLSYAVLYRALGLVDGGTPTSKPITCLYFSIVTWTTLGYGDVRPSVEARLAAASEALVGFIVMVIVIAIFAEAFRHLRNRTYVARGLPPS
jgi:Ion channel